jgi:hypothetical protein
LLLGGPKALGGEVFVGVFAYYYLPICHNGYGSSPASTRNREWGQNGKRYRKTLQEPKTGLLVPFEIAETCQ